ncbi:MAG: hypothetical protein JW751_13885 [Polyangiaceae bacterium]|nr:hypothetical protein [Polyangiaceae bacterium]
MTTLHDKYHPLRDALVTAPEYLALPSREREACTRFCDDWHQPGAAVQA